MTWSTTYPRGVFLSEDALLIPPKVDGNPAIKYVKAEHLWLEAANNIWQQRVLLEQTPEDLQITSTAQLVGTVRDTSAEALNTMLIPFRALVSLVATVVVDTLDKKGAMRVTRKPHSRQPVAPPVQLIRTLVPII